MTILDVTATDFYTYQAGHVAMAQVPFVQGAIALCFAAAPILGQNAPALSLDPGISNLISNFGVIGVLVWYLWYDTRHARPKMLAGFAAEQASQRAENAAQRAASEAIAEKTAAASIAAAEKSATATSAIIDKIIGAFREEQRDTRTYHQTEQIELRRALIEMASSFRAAAHDVRGVAQDVVRKSEVTEARVDAKMDAKIKAAHG